MALLSAALILTILADRSQQSPLNAPIQNPSESERSLSVAKTGTNFASSITSDLRSRVYVSKDGYLNPLPPQRPTVQPSKRPSDLDLGKMKPLREHVYEPTPDSPEHIYETIPGADDPYYLEPISKGGPPTPPARDSDVDELRTKAIRSRDQAFEAENEVSFAKAVEDIEKAVTKADKAAEEAFRSTQKLGTLRGTNVNAEKQQKDFKTAYMATADARMAAARARSRAAELIIEKCLPERRMRWTLISKMASMNMDEAVEFQEKIQEAAKKLNEQISKFHHFTRELSRKQGALIFSWLSSQSLTIPLKNGTPVPLKQPQQAPSYIKLWSERGNEAIHREKQLIDMITEMAKAALTELWDAAVTALDLLERFNMVIQANRDKAKEAAREALEKQAKERMEKQANELAEKQRASEAVKARREMEGKAKKEATTLMEKLRDLEKAASPWWTELMLGVTAAVSTIPFGIFLYAVVTSSTPAAAAGGLGAAAAAVSAAGSGLGTASEEAVGHMLDEAVGTTEAALMGLSHPASAAGSDTEAILTQLTSEALPHIISEVPVAEVAESIRNTMTTALRRRGLRTDGAAALLRRDEALRGMVVDAVLDVMQEAIQSAHVAMFGEDM
ncbi:hypothetical protein CP533_1313 [Ophiocordyceps camponoti-saundersi (nom. inval.)]|nr:hypothetical protein CP533_1313 [Ophiocordyceps camponoti-saundersi (nom. inval.)]